MDTALNKAKESVDHFKLGENLEGLGRFDEAIDEYRKSLEFGFKKDTLLRLIQLCRCIGQSKIAEEMVINNLKFIPENDLFLRNILLNELEMAQKKTILSSKIRSFTITLTNKCNLACLDCEAKNYKWDMRIETIKEIIGFFPYLEYIMWQGGEVFLLDYFRDILAEAKHYSNIKQLIVTNAMLLTTDIIKELVMQPDLVLAISVDGTTKGIYEKIRKGARFEKLIENIGLINSMPRQSNSSIRLHLNVTVMRSNYFQLLDFIDFAVEYGFYSVLLRPVQGNLNNEENIFIRKDKEALGFINKVIGEVEKRAKINNIILDNRIPVSQEPCLDHATEKKERRINKTSLLCYAPWQRLYISWDGNVFPDCMCVWPKDDGIGNVKRQSIEEIWNNEGMQAYRKKLLENNYKDICGPDCVSGNVPERYLTFNR